MCKRLKKVKQTIRNSNEIKETAFILRDPYTYVELEYKGIVGKGFAKRNPIDEPNMQLGYNIALGRALHEIACAVYEEQKKTVFIKRVVDIPFGYNPITNIW